ncbi:MAG: pyridoxal-phosphate dependent enzyme [Sandaracinus sp.]
MTTYATDLAGIRAAHERIAPHVHRTPVLTSRTMDTWASSDGVARSLFFKCENLQRIGAFKIRGAMNAVLKLTDEAAARGVVTHSSGNHAQALALAARIRGIPAHIVMPTNAPEVKREAVRGYGGRVVPCEPTQKSREETAARIAAETGATLVPPYDHADVIEGQGTLALELFDEVPDLDAVIVPLGGGGMISGVALAYRELAPETQVIGAEPALAADAYESKRSGAIVAQKPPVTVADGLRTSLGALTFPVVRDLVSEIVLVDEEPIVACTKLVFERMKLVIEPSAGVSVAVALGRGQSRLSASLRRIGVVLCGGNVDLDALPWLKRA